MRTTRPIWRGCGSCAFGGDRHVSHPEVDERFAYTREQVKGSAAFQATPKAAGRKTASRPPPSAGGGGGTNALF